MRSAFRRILRNKYIIPGGLMTTVALGGFLAFVPASGADTTTATTTPASTTAVPAATAVPETTSAATPVLISPETGAVVQVNLASSCHEVNASFHETDHNDSEQVTDNTDVRNAGNPALSDYEICLNGKLHRYGNQDISYINPPTSYIKPGSLLFAEYCTSCHGPTANGTTSPGSGGAALEGPNLQGVGTATVNFWVSTGRMPDSDIKAVEAERKPPRLTPLQSLEVAAYVNSLDPGVPAIPVVHNVDTANLANGADLFALNCAACHTITGAGDALAYGTNAPTLHQANPTQIASAIRTGPANMPRFTGNLTDRQVRDIVAYVSTKIQHPSNPGGAGLGGVGPVAEGFVALLFGVGGLFLICFWIGDRS
jgi:ubiquinol-cytochrome c reductase cytochrome c subunit